MAVNSHQQVSATRDHPREALSVYTELQTYSLMSVTISDAA